MIGDQLAQPVPRLWCDACERVVPAAGCSTYRRYTLCAACTREYERAWALSRCVSAGQYVRDKRFGEGERYALAE
jgi:hypothetical protein